MDETPPILSRDYSPVNMAMIQKATRGNPEKIQQLVFLYLKQNGENLHALGLALQALETEKVSQLAHAMAGSGSFLGATELTIPLLELEKMGKSGQLIPKSRDLFSQIEKEFARIQLFFRRLDPPAS